MILSKTSDILKIRDHYETFINETTKPHQSWFYFSGLIDAYSNSSSHPQPRIIVEADFILPLEVKSRFGMQIWRGLGGSRIDYADILTKKKLRFTEILQEYKIRNLFYTHISDLSNIVLEEYLSNMMVPNVFVIPLPNDFQQYKEKLRSMTRRNANRYDRKAKNELGYHLHIGEALEDVDSLLTLYENRWGSKQAEKYKQSYSFLFDKHQLLAEVQDSSIQRKVFLSVDNTTRPMAILTGFRKGKTFYCDQYIHDPYYAKWSIGSVLLVDVIRWSIENGCEVLDTGNGAEPYKIRFGGEIRNSYRICTKTIPCYLYDYASSRYNLPVLHQREQQLSESKLEK